ncbi:TPA: LPXTG cell wall anchor domain-containing protein, partial [Streptococcus suis]
RIKAEQDAKAKAEAEKLANEAKAKAEAERLAREKAEQEAKENQDGEVSDKPEEPVQPEQPSKSITEPIKPESPSEEQLIAEKGDPAYHEVPAFAMFQLSFENVKSNNNETVVVKVQDTNAFSNNLEDKAIYSRVERAKALPVTGTKDSTLLSLLGIGLASLSLAKVIRKNTGD